MTVYKVSFYDEIKASSEDEAMDDLMEYLRSCVKYGDLTAFDIEVKK